MDERRLRTQLGRLLDMREEKRPSFRAALGDANGTVSVSGRANYVYVRSANGETIQVYNDVAPLIADMPVWVGYDQFTPTLLRVLTLDRASAGTSETAAPGTGAHGESHAWGGVDIAPVYLRQIMDLQPVISGSFEITIQRGLAQTGAGGWNQIIEEILDMSGYMPADGARWCLVYTDANGELQVRAGTAKESETYLAFGDVPAAMPGEWPICAVRLYAGQTTLVEEESTLDLVDLRFAAKGPGWVLARGLALLEAEIDFALTRLAVQAGLERRNAAFTAAEFDFALSKHVVGG